MSESKATPGPWKIINHRNDEQCLYIESARDGIATVFTGTLTPEGVIDANANLIAAAPELLEALKKLANESTGFLAMADRSVHGNTNMNVLRDRIASAVAAILKAEGR